MRKGQLADIGTYLVMGVVIAITFLVGWLAMSSLNDEFDQNDQIPQHAKDINKSVFGDWGTNLDKMFMLIYIGILLGSLVLSYVLRSNPAMFFVMVLIMFIFSMIAGYFGNAWVSMGEEPLLSGVVASFTITTFIMNNYLFINLLTVTLMIIVFFAKPSDGGGF